MEACFSLGVYGVTFQCKLCSSQSCNALSTHGIETFHPGLGLDPDTECKKIVQLCKSLTESNNVFCLNR